MAGDWKKAREDIGNREIWQQGLRHQSQGLELVGDLRLLRSQRCSSPVRGAVDKSGKTSVSEVHLKDLAQTYPVQPSDMVLISTSQSYGGD